MLRQQRLNLKNNDNQGDAPYMRTKQGSACNTSNSTTIMITILCTCITSSFTRTVCGVMHVTIRFRTVCSRVALCDLDLRSVCYRYTMYVCCYLRILEPVMSTALCTIYRTCYLIATQGNNFYKTYDKLQITEIYKVPV